MPLRYRLIKGLVHAGFWYPGDDPDYDEAPIDWRKHEKIARMGKFGKVAALRWQSSAGSNPAPRATIKEKTMGRDKPDIGTPDQPGGPGQTEYPMPEPTPGDINVPTYPDMNPVGPYNPNE